MKRAINKLSLGLSGLSGIALVILMLTMVADAVGRKLVGTLPGAYETAMALMVLVMFLPLGHAEMKRAHVVGRYSHHPFAEKDAGRHRFSVGPAGDRRLWPPDLSWLGSSMEVHSRAGGVARLHRLPLLALPLGCSAGGGGADPGIAQHLHP